jgi:cobalt-zinc-cadmium efflux system membrane fusion protein
MFAFLLVAAVVAGCNQAAEKAVPPPRVENNAVIFEPASPQLSSIHTALAEPQRDAVLRFNGRLVWDEDHTARVFTPLAGKVMSIAVRAGDAVKAGHVLAVLSAPDLGSAQAEARKAEQDYLLAQKNRSRIEELHGAGVAPAKDLHVALAEEARAASERARTQARLRAYGAAAGSVNQAFALRSPLAGVVVERQLNPGQELRPDAAPPSGLFVISDPSHLWFVLDVSEKDLRAVRPGVEVRLATAALEDERAYGRIIHVADLVDPQTRTVKVRGTVKNSERRLKAEMFVTAEMRVPPAGIGLLIPGKAVYLRGEQYFVFVEAGPGKFVRKAVRIGPATDGHSLILEGITAQDKVVTDGNLLLERVLASKD